MSGILGQDQLGDLVLGSNEESASNFAFGQAQANILQTYSNFAQAQAFIIYKQSAVAQAQSQIIHTFSGYGQAQATILAFPTVHAQAQARIKQSYLGFAQAQAHTYRSEYGLGQAQAQIFGFPTLHGQAQAYIFNDKVFAQSQSKIKLVDQQSYGQAQTYIRSGYFAHVLALIDSPIKNVSGQALGAICRTDTFTRTTSFGLGTGYTWQDWETAFNTAADSTYEVDGSKVIDSAPLDANWDSYSIDANVTEQATVQFDFTTGTNPDNWSALVIIFGESYTAGRHSFGVYQDTGTWYLTPTWNVGATVGDLEVTLDPSTTYTVKWSYDGSGNFAGKVWETGQSEPDWMIYGTTLNFVSSNRAWIYLEFGEDIASFDNLTFCIFEPFVPVIQYQSYGQAQALIWRPQGYGQAQATITNYTPTGHVQAFIAWTTGVAPFRDDFNRTTVRGLGSDRYIWTPVASSIDHPAVSQVYVNGSEVVIPPGVQDSYYLGYTFGYHNRFEVEIPDYPASPEAFFIEFIVPGSEEITIRLYRATSGVISYEIRRAASFVLGGVFGVGAGDYKIAVIWHPTFIRVERYKNGVFQGAASNAGPMPNNFGNTNLLIKVIGSTTQTRVFDNLYLDTGTNGFGQAQARIKKLNNTRSAQAQARIKVTTAQHAQAQAIVNQAMVTGQAQAIIDFVFTVGYAQAQALVIIRRFVFAQARAHIKRFGWLWAQTQAFIKPRVGIGQAQAYIVGAITPRYAQSRAHIKKLENSYGQAQAQVGYTLQAGQAQALISSTIKYGHGQARAKIARIDGTAQAQASIKSVNVGVGQVQAQILAFGFNKFGQSQAFIKRTISYGQAQGWILRTEPGHLIKYNNYILPGYLQSEVLVSNMRLSDPETESYDFADRDEYLGLSNKEIDIKMQVLTDSYAEARAEISLASTMLRSNRTDYVRLVLKNPDRYYLAQTKRIVTQQTAGSHERSMVYEVTFDVRPWRYGQYHTLTGPIDTDNVGRTLAHGTWTPAIVTLTGTNPTVSGYTDAGEFTGFISAAGSVSNLIIDSEAYTATIGGVNRNDLMNNLDYEIYIGPGRTRFATTGVTDITVEYNDRWPL